MVLPPRTGDLSPARVKWRRRPDGTSLQPCTVGSTESCWFVSEARCTISAICTDAFT
jgi:hypothetical protein